MNIVTDHTLIRSFSISGARIATCSPSNSFVLTARGIYSTTTLYVVSADDLRVLYIDATSACSMICYAWSVLWSGMNTSHFILYRYGSFTLSKT
jgi:hypothetical protein